MRRIRLAILLSVAMFITSIPSIPVLAEEPQYAQEMQEPDEGTAASNSNSKAAEESEEPDDDASIGSGTNGNKSTGASDDNGTDDDDDGGEDNESPSQEIVLASETNGTDSDAEEEDGLMLMMLGTVFPAVGPEDFDPADDIGWYRNEGYLNWYRLVISTESDVKGIKFVEEGDSDNVEVVNNHTAYIKRSATGYEDISSLKLEFDNTSNRIYQYRIALKKSEGGKKESYSDWTEHDATIHIVANEVSKEGVTGFGGIDCAKYCIGTDSNPLYGNNTDYFQTTAIEVVEETYNLWVGKLNDDVSKINRISRINKDHIFDSNGNLTGRFEPKTNKLHLTDYHFSGPGNRGLGSSAGIYYSGTDDFHIVIDGDNTLTIDANGYSSVIYTAGKLEITSVDSDAQLTLKSETTGNSSYVINTGKEFCNNSKLIAVGNNDFVIRGISINQGDFCNYGDVSVSINGDVDRDGIHIPDGGLYNEGRIVVSVDKKTAYSDNSKGIFASGEITNNGFIESYSGSAAGDSIAVKAATISNYNRITAGISTNSNVGSGTISANKVIDAENIINNTNASIEANLCEGIALHDSCILMYSNNNLTNNGEIAVNVGGGIISDIADSKITAIGVNDDCYNNGDINVTMGTASGTKITAKNCYAFDVEGGLENKDTISILQDNIETEEGIYGLVITGISSNDGTISVNQGSRIKTESFGGVGDDASFTNNGSINYDADGLELTGSIDNISYGIGGTVVVNNGTIDNTLNLANCSATDNILGMFVFGSIENNGSIDSHVSSQKKCNMLINIFAPVLSNSDYIEAIIGSSSAAVKGVSVMATGITNNDGGMIEAGFDERCSFLTLGKVIQAETIDNKSYGVIIAETENNCSAGELYIIDVATSGNGKITNNGSITASLGDSSKSENENLYFINSDNIENHSELKAIAGSNVSSRKEMFGIYSPILLNSDGGYIEVDMTNNLGADVLTGIAGDTITIDDDSEIEVSIMKRVKVATVSGIRNITSSNMLYNKGTVYSAIVTYTDGDDDIIKKSGCAIDFQNINNDGTLCGSITQSHCQAGTVLYGIKADVSFDNGVNSETYAYATSHYRCSGLYGLYGEQIVNKGVLWSQVESEKNIGTAIGIDASTFDNDGGWLNINVLASSANAYAVYTDNNMTIEDTRYFGAYCPYGTTFNMYPKYGPNTVARVFVDGVCYVDGGEASLFLAAGSETAPGSAFHDNNGIYTARDIISIEAHEGYLLAAYNRTKTAIDTAEIVISPSAVIPTSCGYDKVTYSLASHSTTAQYTSGQTYTFGTERVVSLYGVDYSYEESENTTPHRYSRSVGTTRKRRVGMSGKWEYHLETKTWTLTGMGGRQYKSEWAYAHNPYAADKQEQDSWFYFDDKGNMLTGWHWIKCQDGKYRCFYMNETADGTLGRMYENTTTPDGYTVDKNGYWTVNGVVQERD